MYLACFLRLWMTSESALGAQTIILWHLRESGPEKQTTNNKKVPWQNTFAMFVFHYWCNPVVFLFLDQWKKKILGFLKQLSHILWEYWNTRLYKQTGNGQCGGGAWEEWVGSHSSNSGKVWYAFGVQVCSEECLWWYCDILMLGL